MKKIDYIFDELSSEMTTFNQTLKGVVDNERLVIREAIGYILASQGKQVRPLLLILSALLYNKPTHKSYIAASLIELTHCASLIHDDIVDEAYMRRNLLSAYAIWRNKNSVLIGDYIFSRAIKIATSHNLFDLLGRIAAVIENMSVGELEQSSAAQKLDITEKKYFDIINSKTAELISAGAYAGADSVGASQDQKSVVSEFGKIVGTIFQIRDDMLDYSVSNDTGKIACNDLKERKITLPLIYALEDCSPIKRALIMRQIARAPKSDSALREVYEFVMQSGAMERCEELLQKLSEEAKSTLEGHGDDKYRQMLFDLVDYFITRTK